MQADEEGFLYPNANENMCVGCKLCEKSCPNINVQKDYICEQTGYVVQNRDQNILKESTSGGAFTPIAEYVIRKGGIVYGAAFNENCWTVAHVGVDNISSLVRFRGSKYVQSEMGYTYQKTKKQLDAGRWVCFSGTPCQIQALLMFLKKPYEKLITVDVECRAVPSPLVLKKYLKVQEKEIGFNNISNVRFRDKTYGYSYSTMSIYIKNGAKDYHRGIESDLFLRMFFSGICDRPSCGSCQFRSTYHKSDFTIWDCFAVDRFAPQLNNNRGASRITCNSEKAVKIFGAIREKFYLKEVEVSRLRGVNEKAYQEKLVDRDKFFHDLNSRPASEVFDKYFPETIKVKFLKNARFLAYKTGAYKVMKKVWDTIKNRW